LLPGKSTRQLSKAGIQPKHAGKLEDQLSALNYATRPEDMNLPGWDWASAQGQLGGALGGVSEWQLAIDVFV
jgi:proteic killer suppression protein